MAQKTVCDVCGRDIVARDSQPFEFHNGRLRVSIHATVEIHRGDWQKADVCRYCLIDALATQDDRLTQDDGLTGSVQQPTLVGGVYHE